MNSGCRAHHITSHHMKSWNISHVAGFILFAFLWNEILRSIRIIVNIYAFILNANFWFKFCYEIVFSCWFACRFDTCINWHTISFRAAFTKFKRVYILMWFFLYLRGNKNERKTKFNGKLLFYWGIEFIRFANETTVYPVTDFIRAIGLKHNLIYP